MAVVWVFVAFCAGEMCGMLAMRRPEQRQPRQDEARPKLRLVK